RVSPRPAERAGGSGAGRIEVHSVVGSLQERTLLDQVFRRPQELGEPVSTVMDPPFALVDVKEEVERVFPLLAAGSPAVLAQEEGVLVGIITRADLLDFVAHQKNGG